ncbi:beta strand repeat-containing protein [Flavobacterium filum]|uniref:beta strand repeat-containing protein n=1 Tax=Flavobacterium filum TaxID=370974 RepID=UPI0003FC4DE7|nr:putative Ig domain-containing protein [Flavobacterium filum]
MINSTCSSFTGSKSTFKKYVAILGLMVTFLAFSQSPTNGGFEDGTTGWTTAGSASTTNARTGANSLLHTTSSTGSNVAHTNANTISVPNNNYGITIAWAIGSNANARASAGGTLNTVTNSTPIATIGTTLTRLTYASAQNTSGTTQNFSGRVSSRSVSGSTSLYFDDVIIYSSTTATPDLTKPTSASAFTSGSITSNSIGFSWTNGTDSATGIQNTIILRTTNLSASTPVMNDQGVYSVAGGTSGPNVVSTDWSVISVSVGSGATSFTDNSVASGTSYKYAVIHRDLAYNYSNALVSGTLSSLSGFTISWCNLQFPTSQTIAEGSTFSVYGQVYAAGLTEAAGQGANLNAWVGYSSTNSNPNSGSWTWIPASYNTNVGDNDEFIASLGAGITPGSYFYAYRYQIGSGAYAYGGTGGVWNNDSATLTVNSNLVNWCNVQYPLSGTITQGDVYNVFSKVYDPGITNNTGQGAGISGWIGYSATDSNPNTGSWTWVAASFQGDAGNDDEYFANIATGLAPGTYYYASRYQKTGSTEFRYGGTNGIWNNDSGVLTVNQAIPVISAGSPTGTYNAPFTYSLVATFSPTSYAISSGTLPNGLSLNTTTGVISGTPTQTGVFNVDFTATNNGGTSAPQTITFTINPANQTITFGTLANVPIGTAPFALTATASSGLTVSYESSNTAVATISGNTITIVGVGTADITASQAGDANYNAATDVTRSITVLAVANQIAFVGVPTSGNVGVNLTTFTVEARRPDNSVDTFYNQNITLSQASGTGNISGTLTVQAVNGVATFSTIQFDAASTYTLHANSGSFDQITSGNIVIVLLPTVIAQFDFTTSPYINYTLKNVNVNVSDMALSSGTITTNVTTGTNFPNEPYIAGIGGWGETTQAAAKNFNFTVTANTGYVIEVTSFEFNSLATAAGPSAISFNIASGISTYTANAPDTALLPINQTVSGVNNLTTIPFLIQGWLNGSRSSTGTGNLRIDDVKVFGYVTCLQPTAFNVTGGGTVCVGGSGTLVGLSGSQTGISYQLKLNGNDVGSPVAGTGAALSFGTQTALGTYTVVAINSACSLTVTMNGNAVIATGTTTWSGSPSPSWDNGVPTSGVTAIISANYSEAENIDACALVVNNGAVVSIPAGNVVSLFGGITVETGSSFVLESNAVLLQGGTTNQNAGDITVKRNSQDLMRLDYGLWSSPVENQNLLAFSPLTMANRFYTYNTTTDAYSAITPSTNGFTTGKGYLIRMPDNHPTSPTAWVGNFVGKPNSGDLTIELSTTGTGFNAVGNPYPSPISIATFIANNNGVINGNLYFWRKTNNASGSAYVSYIGGTFSDGPHAFNTIQPGQGFIVQATNAADLQFNNAQRTTGNGVFYRNAEDATASRVWLHLKSNNEVIGNMAVGYREDATNGIDVDLDAAYINDSAVALNSIVENATLAVQHRAAFEPTDVVPLTFKTNVAGSYTIALQAFDGLFENEEQAVYVKDNVTGAEHNLKTGEYVFTTDSGIFNTRFELVYQSTLSVENPTFNNVVVFSKNNALEINAGNETISSLTVFDIRGRKVAAQEEVNTSVASLDLSGVASQVLIVQIKSTNGQLITKKVVH